MVTGKQNRFLSVSFAVNKKFFLLQMHITPDYFEPTVFLKSLLPEICRSISLIIFGRRISRCIIISLIEREKFRSERIQSCSKIHFIGVNSKMHQRTLLKQKEQFFRVTACTILLHRLTYSLSCKMIFQLNCRNR